MSDNQKSRLWFEHLVHKIDYTIVISKNVRLEGLSFNYYYLAILCSIKNGYSLAISDQRELLT
jgi:hypothetical protein